MGRYQRTMKPTERKIDRVASAVVMLALVAAVPMSASCNDRAVGMPVPEAGGPDHPGSTTDDPFAGLDWCRFRTPTPSEDHVDLLFVIDNSYSMENEQLNLRTQFVILMQALKNMEGGLPNVHVGVVSTDLGAGPNNTIAFCEEVGGDAGILGMVGGTNLGEMCIGPGQRYIVDTEPPGCQIDKDGSGVCTDHQCEPLHCDGVRRGSEVLTLTQDEKGCPRCRNYDQTLEEVFSCLADLGVQGCGFEQPLEAMKKALDLGATPENEGFLRENGMLAVVIITDEDDCSASNPAVLFDPPDHPDQPHPVLGYLHSFRCFEYGMNCYPNNGRELGYRWYCEPRPEGDPDSLLFPINRYTGFLESLRWPRTLVVTAIAGPVLESVQVVEDEEGRPDLEPTCMDAMGQGAAPGIRLRAFVDHFNNDSAMDQWAYTSVCTSDFSRALSGTANRIVNVITEPCPARPFAGCRNGPGGTDCAPCLPECLAYDVENPGTPEQKRLRIPWCGLLCETGLCTVDDLVECDYDDNGRCTCTPPLYPTFVVQWTGCAPLRYANALPTEDIDPELFVLLRRGEPSCVGTDCPDGTEGWASACWYLTDETTCSVGSAFRIARAAEPPATNRVDRRCVCMPRREHACDDGQDNDQDCLTDSNDPDCQD